MAQLVTERPNEAISRARRLRDRGATAADVLSPDAEGGLSVGPLPRPLPGTCPYALCAWCQNKQATLWLAHQRAGKGVATVTPA